MADRDFLAWMTASAFLTAACPLIAFVVGLRTAPLETARTYAFTVLVASEALRAFALRSRTKLLFQLGLPANLKLGAVAALTIGTLALALAWEPFGAVLRVAPIPIGAAGGLALLSFAPVTLLELWKPLRGAWTKRSGRHRPMRNGPP